jgi:hypothetical protein
MKALPQAFGEPGRRCTQPGSVTAQAAKYCLEDLDDLLREVAGDAALTSDNERFRRFVSDDRKLGLVAAGGPFSRAHFHHLRAGVGGSKFRVAISFGDGWWPGQRYLSSSTGSSADAIADLKFP